MESKLKNCVNDISKSGAGDFLFLERIGGYLCLDYDASNYILENNLNQYGDYKIYKEDFKKMQDFVDSYSFFGIMGNAYDFMINLILAPVNYFTSKSEIGELVVAIDKGDINTVKKLLKENPKLANECIEYSSDKKCISYPIFLAYQKRNFNIYQELLLDTDSEIVKDLHRKNAPKYNEKLIADAVKTQEFGKKLNTVRSNKKCHNTETGYEFKSISEIPETELFILPEEQELLGEDGVLRPNCYDKIDIDVMKKTRHNVLTNKQLNPKQINFLNSLKI